MKIHHYSNAYIWKEIREGCWQSRNVPGLGACRRVCLLNEEEGARESAIFGLLEAEPDNWVNNKEFPVAWKYLMSAVGKLLITYEPNDEIIENSYIIDWSHKERVLRGHEVDLISELEGEITLEDKLTAENAYWSSKIPLADYIDNPKSVSHIVLPEVITLCTVPYSLIEIAETQPRLNGLPQHEKGLLLYSINQYEEIKDLSSHIDITFEEAFPWIES